MKKKTPPDSWKGSFGEQTKMQYIEVEPGRAVAELEVREEHLNPSGVCHGGVLFTVADDSMGAALHALSPEGRLPTSTQVTINFARSVRPGDRVRVETHVLSHGRRTALVESRLTDEAGRLVALVTAGCLFVEARYAPTEP